MGKANAESFLSFTSESEKALSLKENTCDSTKRYFSFPFICHGIVVLIFGILYLRSETRLWRNTKDLEFLKEEIHSLESSIANLQLFQQSHANDVELRGNSQAQLVSRRKRQATDSLKEHRRLEKEINSLEKRAFKKIRRLRRLINSKSLSSPAKTLMTNTSETWSRVSNHFVMAESTVRNFSLLRAPQSIGPWTNKYPTVSSLTPKTIKERGADHHVIHVKKGGFYFVYGQITFRNFSPLNMMLLQTWPTADRYPEGLSSVIVQCTQSSRLAEGKEVGFMNCYSAGAKWIPDDSYVEMLSKYSNRNLLPDGRCTFMGLIKIR